MPPRGLGHVTMTGVSDKTFQVNPFLLGTGWDVLFHPDDLPVRETEFEIWKIALDGPIGSQLRFSIDGRPLDYINQGWQNSSSQVVPVRAGSTLEFCWNVAFANPPYNNTSNVLPIVTVWLRRQQGIIE